MSQRIEQSVDRFAANMLARLMLRVGDKGESWGDVHPLWVLAKTMEELGEVGTAMNHSFDGSGGLVPGSDQHLIEAVVECHDVGAMVMILAETLSDALEGKS